MCSPRPGMVGQSDDDGRIQWLPFLNRILSRETWMGSK